MAADSEPAFTSVLDASALIALLHDEPGADVVEEAVAEGAAISVVNFAEVLSKLAEHGEDPERVKAQLVDPGDTSDPALMLEPMTEADCVEVAKLRPLSRSLGLSLADRTCLALARRLQLPVLTADQTWRQFDYSVEIRLIR